MRDQIHDSPTRKYFLEPKQDQLNLKVRVKAQEQKE